jgi:hypothetical protein
VFLGFDANGDPNGFEQGHVKRRKQAHAGNGAFRQCRRDGLGLGSVFRSILLELVGGGLDVLRCEKLAESFGQAAVCGNGAARGSHMLHLSASTTRVWLLLILPACACVRSRDLTVAPRSEKFLRRIGSGNPPAFHSLPRQ